MNMNELEKINHGSPEFPLALYKVNKDFPRYRMICHWHVEYELIRVLGGELHLKADEKEFVLRKGDSIMIHGGTLHSGEPIDCDYECSVFSIAPLLQLAACRDQLSPILNSDIKLSKIYTPRDREISTAIDEYFSTLKSEKNGNKLAAISGLFKIFSLIIEKGLYHTIHEESSSAESRYVNRFKDVLTWLEDNYKENLSLDDLASIAGFSPKYFCRLFNKLTGRSPIDYLNCYRIDRASEMLMSTDKPIIDIATDCGFWDLSYFVKVFKKYKGIPPGQYRKKLTE